MHINKGGFMRIEMDSLLTKLGYWEIQMLKNQIHWICKQYHMYRWSNSNFFVYAKTILWT